VLRKKGGNGWEMTEWADGRTRKEKNWEKERFRKQRKGTSSKLEKGKKDLDWEVAGALPQTSTRDGGVVQRKPGS